MLVRLRTTWSAPKPKILAMPLLYTVSSRLFTKSAHFDTRSLSCAEELTLIRNTTKSSTDYVTDVTSHHVHHTTTNDMKQNNLDSEINKMLEIT